jgi:anti-anti-sigma regulatory factor
LNDSLTKLQDANEALKKELDERIRASQVAAEHERTIEEQHRELLAMSTPLIPITERVVVMPLIGILSPERARQVVETALQGAVNRRAAVVLLDVTGLEQLDSDVASMLARMAKSLRLLGCRTILSGIRPSAAQTLVQLGIDFADLATHGTLQSAIAVALAMDNKASAGVYNLSHKPSRASRG